MKFGAVVCVNLLLLSCSRLWSPNDTQIDIADAVVTKLVELGPKDSTLVLFVSFPGDTNPPQRFIDRFMRRGINARSGAGLSECGPFGRVDSSRRPFLIFLRSIEITNHKAARVKYFTGWGNLGTQGSTFLLSKTLTGWEVTGEEDFWIS